jgi:plasmid stabilization system protein ParE
MSRQVFKRPNVDNELIHFYLFIAQDKIEPAERFLDVAEAAFLELAERPGIGRLLETDSPKLAGIHLYPLPAPYRSYLILYRATPESIEILTVMHGYRDYPRLLERLA